MDRQHRDSCECGKSELDLFSIPPTQTGMEYGYWTDSYPPSTITDNGPIEFTIMGDSSEYIDIANTFIYMKVKIVKDNGTPEGVKLDGTKDFCGPVNNFLHALFEDIIVRVGDKVISYPTNCYPYRAYIETLLSLGPESKSSQQTMALWYDDTPGSMDGRTTKIEQGALIKNEGLIKRASFIERNKDLELIGRPHCDIVFQERFLIDNLPVKFILKRSNDYFSIMAPANTKYKVKIKEAILYSRRVKLSNSVSLAHKAALLKEPAKYPVTRVQCKYFTIPSNVTSVNHENLFQGQMPTRIIIGLVPMTAFNGDFGYNPFNFSHKYLNEIMLFVGGIPTPIKRLTPKFYDQTLMSYMSLFTGTGKWGRDEGCGFGRDDYAQGYTLYAWDLSADLSDGGDHFQLRRNTSLRVEMKFDNPLDEAINAIVYAEFQNMIMVNNNRQVIHNFDDI